MAATHSFTTSYHSSNGFKVGRPFMMEQGIISILSGGADRISLVRVPLTTNSGHEFMRSSSRWLVSLIALQLEDILLEPEMVYCMELNILPSW